MKRFVTIFFVLLLSTSAFAHSNEEIERDLIGLLDEIEKYSSYSSEYSDDRDDKLFAANKKFKTKLLEYTSQHADTLRYSFPKLDKRMQIETAPDQGLRVYSWDTLTGGTMHMYENVYQYHGVEGVFATGSFKEEGDAGAFVNGISNVKTKTGTVYLVSSTAVLSTSDRGQAVRAFQVDGNTLSDDEKIFKTSSGLTNSIGFSYNFFSVVNRTERPVRLFKYDSKTESLSFPVVIADNESPQGKVTSKKIVYRFNGKHFVRVKN